MMQEFSALVDQLPPLHPGEILREEFLIPLGLTAGMVARAISVPRTRIERIVSEQIGISADTALRLGQLFDTSPNFWMNAQAGFDLDTARARLDQSAIQIPSISKGLVALSMSTKAPPERAGRSGRRRTRATA